MLPLGNQCKVDHHDRVLFYNSDQKDDADDRDHVEVDLEQHKREHGADACRRQGGDDGERMHQALIKNAENDVKPRAMPCL